MGAQNAKSDLENYRQGYPDEIDDPRQNENLRFYKGLRKSVPDGESSSLFYCNNNYLAHDQCSD